MLPGSWLSVLRPRLTPVAARGSLLAPAPTVAGEPALQVSLSKDVNSCCTTGPFISGAEHGAAPCGACSPTPSTLYGLSVRRLISFDLRLPSHGASRLRGCFGLVLGSCCPHYERQPDRVPAQGTFTPSVHAQVRRTPVVAADAGRMSRRFSVAAGQARLHSALGSGVYCMNRPLWLDIFYLGLKFTPCALGAFALAAFSVSRLRWPRWSFVPVYAVFFLALVIGWLFILAAWQRSRGSRQAK